MAEGAARARAALRQLLRSVQKNVTAVNGNRMWRDGVMQARTQPTD